MTVLLLSAGLAGQQKPSQTSKSAPAQIVDSGNFGVFLKGKRIATETFEIKQSGELGILTAQVKIDDGANHTEQESEMQVSRNGELRFYRWQSTLPVKQESLVEPKEGLLMEHVTDSEKKRDVPYALPLSTVILDDNFFSHRELLVWRYLATSCVPKNGQLACSGGHFGVLTPHQHAAGNITIELLGRDRTSIKGSSVELNKIKLGADGVEWLLWVADPEDHFRVMKMSVPSSNIEVVRD